MRKSTRALALPASLLLVAGLTACQDQIPVTSSSSAAPQPTVGSSSSGSSSRGPEVRTSTASAAPTVASTRTRPVSELEVGDCFTDTGSEGQEDSTVGDVNIVDCSSPHRYEVYNTSDITATELPTGTAMDDEISRACGDSFSSFVGIDYNSSQAYDVYTFTPTNTSWLFGNHKITCTITSADGTSELTGSAKGTAK